MNWKDQLRSGTFRGVPFSVEAAGLDTGRRAAQHEYPLRDRPYIEDLGRKTREFTIEAYVVGAEYMAARDRLLDACEQAGSGTLIHPYRGEMTVVCTGCRVRESTDEGGLARFSLTFVDAGNNRYPTAALDTAGAVDRAANAGLAVSSLKLDEDVDTSGPGWIADAAAGQIGGLSGLLDGLVAGEGATGANADWTTVSGGLSAALDDAGTSAGTAAEVMTGYGSLESLLPPTQVGLRQSAALLPGESGDLARSGARLAGRVGGLLRGAGMFSGSGAAASPARSLEPLLAAAEYTAELPAVPQTTASRKRQAANQEAITAFVRRSAAIEAARTSAALEYASFDDAVSTRDAVVAALESQMETADDDAVYTALADLRTATVKDLGTRGASLKRLTTWRPAQSSPALVVAHRLYGDAGREGEIVVRNRIRHPGRVPGGTELEVLYA